MMIWFEEIIRFRKSINMKINQYDIERGRRGGDFLVLLRSCELRMDAVE